MWYSNAYILVSGTIKFSETGTVAPSNNRKKYIIIKNSASFTDCMSEINNMQIDNAKNIDIVKWMFNLIEYSDNYSKASGSLWYCNRDERFFNANGAIAEFSANNNNYASCNLKTKLANRTGIDGTKKVKNYGTFLIFNQLLENSWNGSNSQETFVLMKTSWRRLSSLSSKDVIKTNIFALVINLQKTFSRRLG